MMQKGMAMAIIPVVFDDRQIRRALHDGEWWFEVEDVCGMLMDRMAGAAGGR